MHAAKERSLDIPPLSCRPPVEYTTTNALRKERVALRREIVIDVDG